MIFNDPVITDDGVVYERDAITEWLSKNRTSPLTTKEISDKLVDCRIIKNLVEDLIKLYPELKDKQYIISIDEIMRTKKFSELHKHKNIDIKQLMDKDYLHVLCGNADNDTLKHIIDNATNLRCKADHGSMFIHYVCQFSKLEIVRYLVEKDGFIDFESMNNTNMRPIHYACQNNSDISVMQYLVEMGVDLEAQTVDGWRPIHHVCMYGNDAKIQYILGCKVDLTCRITRCNNVNVSYNFIDLIKLNNSRTS